MHENVLAAQAMTSIDPTINKKSSGTGVVIYNQITNDLTTTGFTKGLTELERNYMRVYSAKLPVPPRVVSDCDATVIKSLLKVCNFSYECNDYYKEVWEAAVKSYIPYEAHQCWLANKQRLDIAYVGLDANSIINTSEAPSAVVPFCAAPFPNMNVDPITKKQVVPILFCDKTFVGACGYHCFSDVRQWFKYNVFMKTLPVRQKAFYQRLALLFESIILNSPLLAGMGAFPTLVHLLHLLTRFLGLPKEFSVPSVHLDGHLLIRHPTESELEKHRAAEKPSQPTNKTNKKKVQKTSSPTNNKTPSSVDAIVAVAVFNLPVGSSGENIAFQIKFFGRHQKDGATNHSVPILRSGTTTTFDEDAAPSNSKAKTALRVAVCRAVEGIEAVGTDAVTINGEVDASLSLRRSLRRAASGGSADDMFSVDIDVCGSSSAAPADAAAVKEDNEENEEEDLADEEDEDADSEEKAQLYKLERSVLSNILEEASLPSQLKLFPRGPFLHPFSSSSSCSKPPSSSTSCDDSRGGSVIVVRNRWHCEDKDGNLPLLDIFENRTLRLITVAPTLLSSLFPNIIYSGRTSIVAELAHRKTKNQDFMNLPQVHM